MNSVYRIPLPIFFTVLLACIAVACTANGPSTVPNPGQSSVLSAEDERERNPKHFTAIDSDTMEPGQICVVNRDPAAADRFEEAVRKMGYTRQKRRHLKGLGFVMSIFGAPQGYTVRQGILELRDKFPGVVIDANHRYRILASRTTDPHRYGQSMVGWTTASADCRQAARIGLVDTHIDRSHPALVKQDIVTRSFLPDTVPTAPESHGTAIATLLVGRSSQDNCGLLPRSQLVVAEIFRHRDARHVDTTTWSIARALDWLVGEGVQVINLSFGGPRNALLSLAVSRTLNQGIVLVAAAGYLEGGGGEPEYPAAQQGVLAVTALDAAMQPYRHVRTGRYIAYSAPGVDIWVPGKGGGKFVSGTSFAAPFVTAAIASLQLTHPAWETHQVLQVLEKSARDLGEPGRDPIFGWGLVQAPFDCPQ